MLNSEWLNGNATGGRDGARPRIGDEGDLEILDDILSLLIASDEEPSPPPASTNAAPRRAATTPVAIAPAPPAFPDGGQFPCLDARGDSSVGGVTPPVSDCAKATAEPVEKKKKRRKRPKDELDYLRDKVAELEQQLSTLKEPASPASDGAGIDLMAEEDLAVKWRDVASRQKQEVEHARATNAHLRSALEGQLAVAQQLKEALQQHFKIARMEGLTAIPAAPSEGTMLTKALFHSLNAKLDGQYTQIDNVLREAGLEHAEQAKPWSNKLRTSDAGTFFEMSHCHTMPFPMLAVHRAAWRSINLNVLSSRGIVEHVTDDTINMTFSETLQSAQGNVTMKGTMAFRRYIEESRIVTVWSGVVEMEGSMYVRLREEGWSSMAPAKINPAHASVSINVARATPEVADVATAQERRAHIGEMTDLVLGTYRRFLVKVNQGIENLLLADPLAVGT